MKDNTENMNNSDFGQNMLNQVMENWITPEIRKRQQSGKLPQQIEIYGAQVIFFGDGRPPLVRINDEIKGAYEAKYREGVDLEKGKEVDLEEIEEIVSYYLTEDKYSDCGHITFINHNGKGFISFDLRYNRETAKTHLKLAKEYYELSVIAFDKKYINTTIDNLFSACELAAKAQLLNEADSGFKKKTNHNAIKSRFNQLASYDRIPVEHKNTFNELSNLRLKARYLNGPMNIDRNKIEDYMKYVHDLILINEKFYEDKKLKGSYNNDPFNDEKP